MVSILLQLDRCVSPFLLLIQVQIKRKIGPGIQWQSGINWIQIQQARHLSQIYVPALEHNVPKNRTWIHSFSLT